MVTRQRGGPRSAWLGSLPGALPGFLTGLLPAVAVWLVAVILCLGSWHLLRGAPERVAGARAAEVEMAASMDLAPYLLHPGSPEFQASVRALLQRSDTGFAYLRVRDGRGLAVASAGRLDTLGLGFLPQPWARSLRLFIYRTISTPHSGPLIYQGRQIGSLEYGLLPAGGAATWRPWAGALGLLLGLTWLFWASLRLKSELQGLWLRRPPEVSRQLGAHLATPAAGTPAQASAVAQEQTGQLMAVFDHAVIMADRQRRVSYLNSLAERIIGYTMDEARGRVVDDILELHDADSGQPATLPVTQCLTGDTDRVRQRLRLRRRMGAQLELEIITAPVRDRAGVITGALIALHPPARRASTLPVARPQSGMPMPKDSAALSMMLLDQVLESVITTDSQDRIQFANGRALETFGYTLEDLRGSHISKLLPAPFLKQAKLRIADYMQAQEGGLPQVVARRQDGTQFPVVLVVHPVAYREQQGHVITVRKASVPTQTGFSPRLRNILDSSTEEVLVLEADTMRVIDANGNARRNLGYGADQLGRMTLLQLSPQLTADALGAHLARLRTGVDEQVVFQSSLQRADASRYEAELRLHLLADESRPVLLVTVQDLGRVVAARGRAFDEDRLEFLAHHDSLTGLPSRQLFLDRVRQTLESAAPASRPFAVLYTGLSGFRAINDSYGYETGDLLLKAVANRLSGLMGTGDTVARLGGDEFTIILDGTGRADLSPAVKRIQDAFAKPLSAGGQDIAVNMSIGATCYPQDSGSPEQMLLHADAAMRQARGRGKREWQMFESGVTTVAQPAPDSAVSVLRRLVTEGKLSVDFQPLVDMRAMQTMAAEIFLHWQHVDRGVLRTTEQVQAASRTKGLTDEIVQWVMECACQQYSAWRNMELPTLPILLNMSALSMDRVRMLERLRDLIAQYRIPPDNIVIGYSETDLIRINAEGDDWLNALRDLGLRLCIDDLDSMPTPTLRRLDVDLVRLTPRATAGLPASTEALALSRKVIGLAQQVGARIAACNIERTEQMNVLADLGCHIFQGRIAGEMMTTREFARELARVEVGAL